MVDGWTGMAGSSWYPKLVSKDGCQEMTTTCEEYARIAFPERSQTLQVCSSTSECNFFRVDSHALIFPRCSFTCTQAQIHWIMHVHYVPRTVQIQTLWLPWNSNVVAQSPLSVRDLDHT